MVVSVILLREKTPVTNHNWSGNCYGTAGIGGFVTEKWIEKVFVIK